MCEVSQKGEFPYLPFSTIRGTIKTARHSRERLGCALIVDFTNVSSTCLSFVDILDGAILILYGRGCTKTTSTPLSRENLPQTTPTLGDSLNSGPPITVGVPFNQKGVRNPS